MTRQAGLIKAVALKQLPVRLRLLPLRWRLRGPQQRK
jgi:hypothetical protein